MVTGMHTKQEMIGAMGMTNSRVEKQQQIFVSYAHTDSDLVFSEIEWLKSQAFSIWYDQKIKPGVTWADELASAIDDSTFIVFFVSSQSIRSPHCLDEIAYALGAGKQILAVYIEPVELQGGLKLSMSRTQAILHWQLKEEEYRNQFRMALEHIGDSTGPDRRRMGMPAHRVARQVQRIWQVPLHRNLHFLGRDDSLEDISTIFDDAKQPVILALTGLGGVGKSQLALEYAYRYMQKNQVVAWIRAESQASFAADFATLATALGLEEANKADMHVVIAAVHAWLEKNENWFLVLDNLEGPQALEKFLPRHLRGHVLVTTRYQSWGSTARNLALTPFDVNVARDFVLSRTNDGDAESALELVAQLGGLPLALEEACAYMDATGRSIASYLKLFQSHHHALLSRSRPRGEYPATLQTTWEVSFLELEKTQPAAVRLVNLLAFLGPDDVPESLLLESDVLLDGKLLDQLEMDDLVASLRHYSLIKVDHGAVSLHRLVQMVIRDRLSEELRRQYAISALELVEKAYPAGSSVGDMLPDCSRLLPHAVTALGHTDGMAGVQICAGRLMGRTGIYQCARGALREGLDHLIKSYQIFLQLDENSIDFAQVSELYGRVEYQCGNLEEARALLEKALTILEGLGETGITYIPPCLTLLAWICWSIGDAKAAMKAANESTRMVSQFNNCRDPLSLSGQSMVGRLLMEEGKVAEAVKVTDDCVSVIESLGGGRHPMLCSSFLQISQVLVYAGLPGRARAWAQESLTLGTAAYGKYHPLVAGARCIMGQIALEFGELEQAVKEFTIAMDYVRQAPTRISQYSAIASSFMIWTLLRMDSVNEAEALLAEAQTLCANNIAGESTKFRAHIALMAARLSSLNGDNETAINLCTEADGMIQERFGVRHIFRLPRLITRGKVLRVAGSYDEARAALKLGLEIMHENGLHDHPQTMACFSGLAKVADLTDEHEQAVEYRRQAVKGLRVCTGPHSPVTIAMESKLANG